MAASFPEGDDAALAFEMRAAQPFTLALRRPSWAGEGFAVRVNDQDVATLPAAGSYCEITRTWRSGDRVTLALPKRLRLERLPDNPRKGVIMWGPLVLAGDLGAAPPVAACTGRDHSHRARRALSRLVHLDLRTGQAIERGTYRSAR